MLNIYDCSRNKMNVGISMSYVHRSIIINNWLHQSFFKLYSDVKKYIFYLRINMVPFIKGMKLIILLLVISQVNCMNSSSKNQISIMNNKYIEQLSSTSPLERDRKSVV